MPTDEALDAMAIKLTGHPFAAQPGPAEKAMIMNLAIKADIGVDTQNMVELFAEIRDRLLGIDNTIHGRGNAIVEQLEEIDKTLVPVMDWFEKSKLWEGEVHSRK